MKRLSVVLPFEEIAFAKVEIDLLGRPMGGVETLFKEKIMKNMNVIVLN
jgi:hypothetical protein